MNSSDPTPTVGTIAYQEQTGGNSPIPTATAVPEIPGYEFIRELGHGGMGIVFLARDTRLNRFVAVKMILNADFADDHRRTMFQREAEAIARLQHPQIVQVYELGECAGLPFFSLEFCGGGSLNRKLRGEVLEPKFAARIVEQLARAMAYAHEQGVVHRDLKPQNILLDEHGNPKVTDFGLAKLMDSDNTRSMSVMGTPQYMSPEQATESKSVDHRTDIWALGVILYEMLTGRVPFRGDSSLETMQLVRNQEPVSVRQLQPKVPRDLETIAMKCLQKDRTKRYPTSLEFAEDLQRFLEGRLIQARPVGAIERGVRWSRRNPVVSGLLAMVILTLSGGVGVSTRYAIEAKNEAIAAKKAQKNEETARKDEETARKDEQEVSRELKVSLGKTDVALKLAERRLYGQQIREAYAAWQANDVEGAWQAMYSTRRDLRNWEYHYLTGVFHQRHQMIESETTPGRGIAFTPDGKRLVVAGVDYSMNIIDATTGERLHHAINHKDDVNSIAVSPDGRFIASGSRDEHIMICDGRTWQPLYSSRLSKGGIC